MPASLADQLQNRSEFLDLAKFVSLLGKPGEYANDESPVLRKWRVISASEIGDLSDDDKDWLHAYSKVSGELPPDPILDISWREVRLAYLTSKRLNGPRPLVGSEPRKKLREMLISGIMAKS